MNIEAMVTKLQEQDAALGSARDVLNTAHAQAEFFTKKQALARVISGLRNGPSDLEKPLKLLTEAQEHRAAVLAKQAEIEQAIKESPDWREIHDARERDREHDRQQQLALSLQLLRDGGLLRAPGQAYDQLRDIDARIDELQQRIAAIRVTLAAHMQQAEALLGVTA